MQQDAAFRRRVHRFLWSISVATASLILLTSAPTFMLGKGAWKTVTGIVDAIAVSRDEAMTALLGSTTR
jgi:hypothetical protein